ncbi:MAG: SRPBCC domain-containing protein [Pseudomonadota bacterium]
MDTHKFAQIQGGGPVRRIALQNTLAHGLAEVWEVLTEVKHVQHWWPDWQPGGVIEPREGGRICLGEGAWIHGTIKVWRPPHILEFTWQEHLGHAPDWLETHTNSILRIDLVAQSASTTLLNLVQFAPADSAVGGAAGWHHFAGERLTAYLRDGRVRDDPGRFEQLRQLYAADSD